MAGCKYIFLHIPKTAGTSFRFLIKDNYSEQKVYEINKDGFNWKDTSKKRKEDIEWIVGHLYFGIHSVMNYECKYITLLREPVDRIISLYYYARVNKNNPMHWVAVNKTLEEFVVAVPNVAQNHQTKLICGSDYFADLNLAKNIIRTYFHTIDIAANYANFITKLGREFKMKQLKENKYNANDKRAKFEDVSDKAKQFIADHNQIDIQLYNWVKKNGAK